MDGMQRILRTLDTDVSCENKDISYIVDPVKRMHNHDGYEIFLMLDGRLHFGTELSMKSLERGDLVLVKPYEFHFGELQRFDVYDRIVINLRDCVVQELSTEHTDLGTCFYQKYRTPLNVIRLKEEDILRFQELSVALQEALEGKEPGDDVMAKAYLAQLLVLINRLTVADTTPQYAGVMPGLVADTLAYIEQHLTEDITRKDLEQHILHDGAHISRCFKKATGTPLQQFILAKKIALAQEYLREGRSPCDVCYMTGFHNYSNFSRTFSKYCGMSPQQYQMAKR